MKGLNNNQITKAANRTKSPVPANITPKKKTVFGIPLDRFLEVRDAVIRKHGRDLIVATANAKRILEQKLKEQNQCQ